MLQRCFPAAVADKNLGLMLDFIDRIHSFAPLYPPSAAVIYLPITDHVIVYGIRW